MDKYTAEQILGLRGSYDAHALKTAFRAAAAEHHPDAARARGDDVERATERMREVNEAHELLSAQFAGGVSSVRCDDAPTAGGVRQQAEVANPFQGGRTHANPHRDQQRAGRETTADYYADPEFQEFARRQRQRSAQARREGVYESLSREGNPVREDPSRPNPRWYAPVYRFLAGFPYRFVLLFGVCILVGFTDPLHAGRTLGPITLEQFLLAAALVNLIWPILTAPLRALLLWTVDRFRSLSWRLTGN